MAQQALEHELVRGRAAQADVGVAVTHDLVVRAVVLGRQARVAERRQRIGGDGDGVALADDDECGHDGMRSGAEPAMQRDGERGMRALYGSARELRD